MNFFANLGNATKAGKSRKVGKKQSFTQLDDVAHQGKSIYGVALAFI